MKTWLISLALVLATIAIPAVADAQNAPAGNGGGGGSSTHTLLTEVDVNTVSRFMQTISVWIRVFAYSFSVATVVYAGVLYFTAPTNANGPTQAKNALRAVVTGLVIIILAEVIVVTVLSFVTRPDNQQGINAVLRRDTRGNTTPSTP